MTGSKRKRIKRGDKKWPDGQKVGEYQTNPKKNRTTKDFKDILVLFEISDFRAGKSPFVSHYEDLEGIKQALFVQKT